VVCPKADQDHRICSVIVGFMNVEVKKKKKKEFIEM